MIVDTQLRKEATLGVVASKPQIHSPFLFIKKKKERSVQPFAG